MKRPENARKARMQYAFIRLPATVTVAGLFALGLPHFETMPDFSPASAEAQEIQKTRIFGDNPPQPDDQLLLESDEMIYHNDKGLVIATGNVQIAYGRLTLVADRVEFNQQSGRATAIGNVEILEPNGNRIFAQEIDITDDFRDGFISALNLSTPDNTRIAAESAERREGVLTIFNNGVYTACLPCRENPEKPPFWQIRAKKVEVNHKTRMVNYKDASFEFFGKPIMRLSNFSHTDPAIKRKTGFLVPEFNNRSKLGFGYRQGYFFNLAPDYDLSLWGSYFSKQGFLGEAEWRQRLENGEYNIHYAGIRQQKQNAFGAAGEIIDADENDRQALITNGRFDINKRWQIGWNALFQTDENFARTYDIAGLDKRDITNELYLRGIGEKNYFNLSGMDFLVQDNHKDAAPLIPGLQSFTKQQAAALPVLDYNAVSREQYGIGQWSLDVNMTNIQRNAPQIHNFDADAGKIAANERFHGISGNFFRASAEVEWKYANVTDNGLIATTLFSLRGDAKRKDSKNLNTAFNPLLSDESIYQAMPAAMLEIRYPMIARSDTATHIIEPVAQIIARPNEPNIGAFTNDDSQSMVFDTTNLFDRDKFSGFDRMEGGTRANIGFRYSTSFAEGESLNVIAGQSFHLSGKNSFADTRDLVKTGNESGLETDRSDYVASVNYDNGTGIFAGIGVRLDEHDFSLKRSEISTRYVKPDFSFTGSYIFTRAQANTRSILPKSTALVPDPKPRDRHEISGSANFRLDENWHLFGSMTYDIETEAVVRESLGLGYDNECFSFSVSYGDRKGKFNGDSSGQSINFSLGLRTIGGFRRSVEFGNDRN